MKKKRKGFLWKPSTHRWVKDTKSKWITASSFWDSPNKKLKKSNGESYMSSVPLASLFEFLNKQSPEVASRMASRGLIWSPERHRWIRKPDIARGESISPSRYAPQNFGSIAPPPTTPPIPSASNTRATGLETLEGIKSKLSSWEKEFLSSIQDQFKKKGTLSDKQWAVVEKIIDAHQKKVDIDSGKIEAEPLPPIFKKIDKVKKYIKSDKSKEALESMANQVKSGKTLSEKQEDYLNSILESAQKQKKGLTEKATGNIIVRPNHSKNFASATSFIDISGKGAFHPQGRQWLEDNGFVYAGPMTGKYYLPISPEERGDILKEAQAELNRMVEENPKLLHAGMGLDSTSGHRAKINSIASEIMNKKIDSILDSMPALRDMGFTLKRPSGHYDTPKVWKMLFGKK